MNRLSCFRVFLRKNHNIPSDHARALKQYYDALDISKPPYQSPKNLDLLKHAMDTIFLRQTPLVAVDVEAYEKNTTKVTEIGIAVYDPAMQQNSILPIINHTHLITKEHKSLFNGKYCPDNKYKFMGGTSYVMSLKQCRDIMKTILDKYINQRGGTFVGHSIGSDIKWIRNLGIPVDIKVPPVDTFRLFQLSRSRGCTLRGILRTLDLPHGYLHNAGNDAYYTLLAAMALCDPVVRVNKQLDTFIEPPRKTKEQIRKAAFSDRAISVDEEDNHKAIEQLFGIGSGNAQTEKPH